MESSSFITSIGNDSFLTLKVEQKILVGEQREYQMKGFNRKKD